jgi:hypothetical protein
MDGERFSGETPRGETGGWQLDILYAISKK